MEPVSATAPIFQRPGASPLVGSAPTAVSEVEPAPAALPKFVFKHHFRVYESSADSEGKYPCPCPRHTTDPQSYSFEDITDHFQNLLPVLNVKYGPHDNSYRWISPTFIDNVRLREIGIAVNLAMKVLICHECRSVVKPSTLNVHIREQHGLRSVDIAATLKPFDLLDDYPPNPKTIVPAIEGLAIYDAYRCEICPDIFVQMSSMHKHYLVRHAGADRPESLPVIAAQRFHKTNAKSFFAVRKPPLSASRGNISVATVVASVFKALDDAQAALSPLPDVRNVAPWLRITRWHEHVQGLDPKKLVALVDNPTVAEFPMLKLALSALLAEAAALIDSTPVLVLQKLNSPDPQKSGINNTPFRKHQDHETRMVQYMYPPLHLLSMLLRVGSSSYEIALPSHIKDAVDCMATALAGTDLVAASQAVFSVLFQIWTHKWTPTVEKRVVDPTIHYLLLHALQPDGSFVEPKLFTSTIARLEYCMRLIFLKAMHGDGDVEDAALELSVWYQEKVESTFNTVRTLQHLLSSIAYNTISLPKIWWTDREFYRSMLFRGCPISIAQITSMLETVEEDMKVVWERDILLGLPLSVTYAHIYDDLSNGETGYSFTSDPRNPCFADRTLLIKGILGDPQLTWRFVSHLSDTGVVVWNVHAMRSWLLSYSRFQTLQLLRCALTTGSPSRGTELTAMLRTNTPSNPVRNLVMFDSYVTLLCTYLKTSSAMGNDKCIPHALDAFSSDLLIQDLAIARPFAEFAAHLSYMNPVPKVSLYRKHIFVNQDRLFTTADITAALEAVSLRHLGVKIGVSAWRHISTAFRRKLCSRMNDLIEEDGLDSVQAMQSGHNRQTENRIYGLSADSIAGSPEDLLPLFLDASTDWQVELGIVPGGLLLPYAKARSSRFSELFNQGLFRKFKPEDRLETKIQACVEPILSKFEKTHLTPLLSLMGRVDSLLRGSPDRMRIADSGRMVAPLTDFPPTPRTSPGDREVKREPSSDTVYAPPDSPSMEDRALAALRQVLGNPTATWSSPEQRIGVLAMLALKQDVVALMATGSGKSMLAIIPCMVESDRITVLVLPLRSLMEDYERKLGDMSVPYEVYDNKFLSGAANLVMVSADSVKVPGWLHHLRVLNERKPVVRYVFDEAHIPLISSDFRASLKNMYEMRDIAAQVALLSGTITQRAEAVLMQEFGIGDNRLILRARTNRPELQYVWLHTHESRDVASAACALASDHVFADERDRGLIFVPYSDLGEAIATQLKTFFYNGSLSLQERRQMHRSWIEGSHRFMVCTSAFGAGNDYSHTRVVIHAGSPYEMVQYIQEVSRAGRDKSPAKCVLIPTSLKAPTLHKDDPDISGRVRMYTALDDRTECIRSLLTTYIDGEGVQCRDSATNQLCSVCAPPPQPSSGKRKLTEAFDAAQMLAKKRKVEVQLEKHGYVSNFKEQLILFSQFCMFCKVFGGVDIDHHEIVQCPCLRSACDRRGIDRYRAFKKTIRYPQGKVCFRCHVPQGHHDELHAQFQKGDAGCEYPDLIVPLCFAVFLDPERHAEAEVAFSCKWSDVDEFASWCNGTLVKGHFSNPSALFLWYANRH